VPCVEPSASKGSYRPRVSPRRAVELHAHAVLESGSAFEVTIVDLSYDGCRIETPVGLLPETRLKLDVVRLGRLDAHVRWYSKGIAGLCFNAAPARQRTPRKHERMQLTADVSLRQPGRQGYACRTFDLTPSGCKVEFAERPRGGDLIWAKFDGLDALEAEVRWVDGFLGGIEFKRPIYPAVFELLVARLN
jgi:hypothetical protein